MFKNLVRICASERFRSDEALLDLKSPLLALNELHSQALLYLIDLWKQHYSTLTTQHHNSAAAMNGKKKSGVKAATPDGINIIELSQMSERVITSATAFM